VRFEKETGNRKQETGIRMTMDKAKGKRQK
jgi:hypothetical protein